MAWVHVTRTIRHIRATSQPATCTPTSTRHRAACAGLPLTQLILNMKNGQKPTAAKAGETKKFVWMSDAHSVVQAPDSFEVSMDTDFWAFLAEKQCLE